MKTSVKMALATATLAVAGTVLLVGSGIAAGRGAGFGPLGMGPMLDGPAGEVLKQIDTNGDSALSQDEINAAVNGRFAEFDADKNGALSLAEFEGVWAEITRPMAVRAFQFLDPDGDASVTKTEVDDRFGDAVARFDRNEDGAISAADRPGPRHGHGPRGKRHWWQGEDGPDRERPEKGPDGPDGPPAP